MKKQFILLTQSPFDDAYKKAEEYTKDFDLEHTNPRGQKTKTEKLAYEGYIIVEDKR